MGLIHLRMAQRKPTSFSPKEMLASLGNGREAKQPVGAVHPGQLLICAIVFLVCVAASNSWSDVSILLVLTIGSSLALCVGLGNLLRSLVSARVLLVLAAIFHFAFRALSAFPHEIKTIEFLFETSFFVTRLALFIFVSTLMLRLYTPAIYAEVSASGLRYLIGEKLSRNAGHITLLAMSMLPQLRNFLGARKLARKLRRIQVKAGIRERLKFAGMELSSAIRFALEYANVVAIVLWSRGFRSDYPALPSKRFKSSPISGIFAILFCLLSLCTLLPQRTN